MSATIPLPALDPLASFAAATTYDRAYWERPDSAFSIAGIGAAWAPDTSDPTAIGSAWRELLRSAVIVEDDDTASCLSGPVLLGGFAFAPREPSSDPWKHYGAGRLVLPAVMVAMSAGLTTLTVNLLLRPNSDHGGEVMRLLRRAEEIVQARPFHAPPPPALLMRDLLSRDHWQATVARAAQECRDGRLQKVVLARGVAARSADGRALVPAAVLARLRDAYPAAYVFAVAQGDRCFLGATPERLVRLRDSVADVACLAGSAARGATGSDDARLGQRLLASVKDQAEHQIVVRAVRDALSGLCHDLSAQTAPTLMRLHNVQHLYTPVRGRVGPQTSVLDLVARLHPTPAVGGYPRDRALAFIDAHEQVDRGWYAGPLGWIDRRGDGEFAVALRSALLERDRATLFAGCGIVADSRPADEYVETLLKLRPMLTALGGGEDADRDSD